MKLIYVLILYTLATPILVPAARADCISLESGYYRISQVNPNRLLREEVRIVNNCTNIEIFDPKRNLSITLDLTQSELDLPSAFVRRHNEYNFTTSWFGSGDVGLGPLRRIAAENVETTFGSRVLSFVPAVYASIPMPGGSLVSVVFRSQGFNLQRTNSDREFTAFVDGKINASLEHSSGIGSEAETFFLKGVQAMLNTLHAVKFKGKMYSLVKVRDL